MAKKFVRGITDIKNIEHQDFDTNNVNDLLSDGKHNYIHRKKSDGSEEYHNLTNNLKTIQSDDTDLVSVTNYNNTTNSATIRPKHDLQKEQVLESSDSTILITHGENGTDETTSVDVNPEKVLEHENLVSNSDYITIEHEDDSNTSVITTDVLDTKISEIEDKIPTEIGARNLLTKTNQGSTNWSWNISSGGVTVENYSVDGLNAVKLTRTSDSSVEWSFIQYDGLLGNLIKPNSKYTLSFDVFPNRDVTFEATLQRGNGGGQFTNDVTMNKALANQWTKVSCVLTSKTSLPQYSSQVVYLRGMSTTNGNSLIIKNIKLERNNIPTDWTPAPEDKQNTLSSNASIGVDGTGLMQLYSYEMSYSSTSQGSFEGSLNTYAKTVKKATHLTDDPKLEYHFTAEIKAGETSTTVPLNNNDTTYFSYILIKYGQTSGSTQTAMINGFVFSLSGSNLTISRDSSTYNQVVSFSDIIVPQ